MAALKEYLQGPSVLLTERTSAGGGLLAAVCVVFLWPTTQALASFGLTLDMNGSLCHKMTRPGQVQSIVLLS